MPRMVQASETIESVTGMNLNQTKRYWVQYGQQECGYREPQSGGTLPFVLGDESCHPRQRFGYHDGLHRSKNWWTAPCNNILDIVAGIVDSAKSLTQKHVALKIYGPSVLMSIGSMVCPDKSTLEVKHNDLQT